MRINRIKIENVKGVKNIDMQINDHAILVGPAFKGVEIVFKLIEAAINNIGYPLLVCYKHFESKKRMPKITLYVTINGVHIEIPYSIETRRKINFYGGIRPAFDMRRMLAEEGRSKNGPSKSVSSGQSRLERIESLMGGNRMPDVDTYPSLKYLSCRMLSSGFGNDGVSVFDSGGSMELGVDKQEELATIMFGDRDIQTITISHNPCLLNWLHDNEARRCIHYVYTASPKGKDIRSMPFFDIPRISKKLDIMNAGNVISDTELNKLAEEATDLDNLRRKERKSKV